MTKPLPKPDIARCRSDMARLLSTTVAATRNHERRLDVHRESDEPLTDADVEADPTLSIRVHCRLLLRKARIHALAVLRANDSNNLHSLAVQMRPVLECAGQVVFFFHHLMIAPDVQMEPIRALQAIDNRLHADRFQSFLRRSKGRITVEELREREARIRDSVAEFSGVRAPPNPKGRSLKQTDKVASLLGGPAWYGYLSECFTHATKAHWPGLSLHGGVMSISRVEDELAFFVMLDYLVGQMAVMNAYAELCPVTGKQMKPIETTLAELGELRDSARTIQEAAHVGPREESDDARND